MTEVVILVVAVAAGLTALAFMAVLYFCWRVFIRMEASDREFAETKERVKAEIRRGMRRTEGDIV